MKTMIRPELFKLTNHTAPRVIAALFTVLVLAVPTWLAFRPPSEADTYLDAMTAVYAIAAALLAPVLGAWLVGHEYRQGTLRRVLAIDARRRSLLTVKAGTGLFAGLATAAAVGLIGVGGSAAAAAVNGHDLVYDGIVRELAGPAFAALVIGAIAFGLSVIFRSDTYAMLGALGVMVVFGPLLSLIPTVGKYTPSAVTSRIADWIAVPGIDTAAGPGSASLAVAAAVLATTLGLIGAGAVATFDRRDI